MQCTDVNHCAAIQRLHGQIISAPIKASEAIPCLVKISKNTPGWNKYVKNHLDTSLFWLLLWKQSGSPRSGTVADRYYETDPSQISLCNTICQETKITIA